jgi:hypothetical protein
VAAGALALRRRAPRRHHRLSPALATVAAGVLRATVIVLEAQPATAFVLDWLIDSLRPTGSAIDAAVASLPQSGFSGDNVSQLLHRSGTL